MTHTEKAEPKTGRIHSLDGLRGLAASIVLLHHSLLIFPAFAAPYYGADTPQVWSWQWWVVSTPIHLLWEGTGAVYVFFILSGVVLTAPLHGSQRAFNWKQFYPQRLIRLYVPVWAAVVFAVVTFVLVPRTDDMASLWLQDRPGEVTFGAFARDVTLLLGNGRLASPLWSLRWEILFSLLFPLFMWVVFRVARWRALSVVGCLLVVGVGDFLDQDVLRYLPMFAIGMLIVPWLMRPALVPSVRRVPTAGSLWVPLLVAALILLNFRWLAPALQEDAFGAAVTIALNTLGAAVIVFAAAVYPPVKWLLSTRALLWLGKISFSLYLVHEPIVIAAAFLCGPGSEYVAWPAAIIVSLLCGWVFYRWVESPSHVFAKRVGRLPSLQGDASYASTR